MKCAALVTNVGGNSEIIEHGVSGHIIPPKDSQAIIDGLLRLKDKVLRNEYAEKAYILAKDKFSIEKTYGKLEEIFNEKEKTWDCPCHSSRFDIDGKCIKGPSNYDISYKE